MGERFGEYEVVRRLGSGGFGTAYLAEAADGVRVVVKVLHGQKGGFGRAAFRRELEAARRVDSRYVAQVHDHDVDADEPWIAFRAAGTRTLLEAIRAVEGTSDSEVVCALVGAARGLAAMHGAGLTHRDVSPDNILVTPGSGMLIDLGLATLGTASEHSRALAGKMAYLAPEQWTSSETLSASDVWQWGVTAVKALTGHLPFPPARTPSEQQTLAEGEMPDLWGANAAETLLARCLEKDPRARPSAAEAAAQLEALADGSLKGEHGRLFHLSRGKLVEDEGVAVVTDVRARAPGRLRVTAVLGDLAWSGRVARRLVSNFGDVGHRVGDAVAIGYGDSGGTLVIGPLLSALRIGAEAEPALPARCESCGSKLEPHEHGGPTAVCPNGERCHALVLPRLVRQLQLASRMRPGVLRGDRAAALRDVAGLLLEEGVVTNEGDLYDVTDESLSQLAGRVSTRALECFSEDLKLSRRRPFAATLTTVGWAVRDHDALRLVAALPTVEALYDASERTLASALSGALDPDVAAGRARLRWPLPDDEAAERAAELRAWLDVPWHRGVLFGMEAAGVAMCHRPGDEWPPRPSSATVSSVAGRSRFRPSGGGRASWRPSGSS